MKRTLFLLIFLSTLLSNAQLKEKYEKGWIITNNDNKIEGYIKVDDLSKLSSGICFKKIITEKKCQTYKASQLKSFQTSTANTFDLLNLKMDNNLNEVNILANLILRGETSSLYKSIYNSDIFYVIAKDNKNYVLQNNKLITGEKEVNRYNYEGILNLATEGLALNGKKKVKFDEDYFVDIINEYNTSKGIGFEKIGTEYYGQLMYRKYIPKVSRSTSLNTGISYFHYQYKEQRILSSQSLLSIPLQIQQNIFNKSIRPYLFAGLSLNYAQSKEGNNISPIVVVQGFQKTYGINFLYGAGIEIDLFKGVYIKSEYRNEGYSHPITFGIGYIYKRN